MYGVETGLEYQNPQFFKIGEEERDHLKGP